MKKKERKSHQKWLVLALQVRPSFYTLLTKNGLKRLVNRQPSFNIDWFSSFSFWDEMGKKQGEK